MYGKVPRTVVNLTVDGLLAESAVAVATWVAPFPGRIVNVTAGINVAGTSGTHTFDVNKNGTTIFTNQANRPSTLTTATKTAAAVVPAVTTFAAGDQFSLDVDVVSHASTGGVGATVSLSILPSQLGYY